MLRAGRGETAIDCTFGAGGHAEAIAAGLGTDGLLIAVDRDPTVAEYFRDFARSAPCRCELHHGNFADVLAGMDDASADLVYMDLGVSSMQLDRRERGFSYAYDAPLDMRMDPELDRDRRRPREHAAGEDELADIFRRYGEERYAREIARGIVRERARRPFTTTCELVDIIKRSIPTPARFAAGNPARRVFQALRIVVNDELASLGAGPGRGVPGARARRAARRHLVPLARGPYGQGASSRATPPAASARPVCRSACAATSRPCAWSLGGRSFAARHRSGQQPAQQVRQAARRRQALGELRGDCRTRASRTASGPAHAGAAGRGRPREGRRRRGSARRSAPVSCASSWSSSSASRRWRSAASH